jgi:hypothetical protein
MKLLATVSALACLALSWGASAATLRNGGFESGLTGWSTVGFPDIQVTSSYSGYLPVSGSKFAAITVQDPQLTEGIDQLMNFNGNQMLRGYAAFITQDYLPFSNMAYVRLYQDKYNYYTLFSASTATVGSFGSTPWTEFSVKPSAGAYRLEAFAYDPSGDAELPPTLLMDGVSVSAVPEPATWAMLVLGAGLIGGQLRRRRRRALAA